MNDLGEHIADFIINTFPTLTAWIGGMNASQCLALAASLLALGYLAAAFISRIPVNDSDDYDAEWMDYDRWRASHEV